MNQTQFDELNQSPLIKAQIKDRANLKELQKHSKTHVPCLNAYDLM